MDAATIQTRINKGLGIAARVLGTSFNWYRPNGTGNPVAAGRLMGTVNAKMTGDFAYTGKAPNLYGHPIWAAMLDRTLTLPGDYLVVAQGTFFIIAQQPHAPAAAVECDRVLTIKRPASGATGSTFYGGDRRSAETTIATTWPGSVQKGTKGDKGSTSLPNDVRMPWWDILLPVIPGAQILTDDVITDDQAAPRRYIVSTAEITDLGWRITAQQVGA